MVKIKKFNSIVLSVITAVFILLLTVASAQSHSDIRFTQKPSHTVMTEWYNDKGRRQRIYTLEITTPLTLTAPMEESTKGKCVIIQSENLQIKAYTRGKVLYTPQGKNFSGKRITIIPADEIKKGGTLFLTLTPVENKKGTVTAPVYLASNDAYLYSVLSREKAVIISIFILATILVFLLFQLFNNHKRTSALYLILADIALMILLMSGSDLYQFFIASSAANQALHKAMYILLPIIIATGIIQKCRRPSYCR